MNRSNLNKLANILDKLEEEELMKILLSVFAMFVDKFGYDYKDTLKYIKKMYKLFLKENI